MEQQVQLSQLLGRIKQDIYPYYFGYDNGKEMTDKMNRRYAIIKKSEGKKSVKSFLEELTPNEKNEFLTAVKKNNELEFYTKYLDHANTKN